LNDVNFDTFLSPFLEVIKSEATDGPVTARSLAAVEKFVNYGLLTPNCLRMANAVHSIADAVTKTKFIGAVNNEVDECVLFQILQV
jgi:brefeldin A-resistance guanine nucleotide exchange factor 1